HRHPDLVKLLGGCALSPESVVRSMLTRDVRQVPRERSGRALRWILIDGPHYTVVPEVKELPRYAARKRRSPIGIPEAIVGRDALQMRWPLDRHEPLRHGVVGLSNASDVAVRPSLRCNPLDGVKQVALLDLVQESILTVGTPGAANIHVHIRITLVNVP